LPSITSHCRARQQNRTSAESITGKITQGGGG
jgi:hypothetical protein